MTDMRLSQTQGGNARGDVMKPETLNSHAIQRKEKYLVLFFYTIAEGR